MQGDFLTEVMLLDVLDALGAPEQRLACVVMAQLGPDDVVTLAQLHILRVDVRDLNQALVGVCQEGHLPLQLSVIHIPASMQATPVT